MRALARRTSIAAREIKALIDDASSEVAGDGRLTGTARQTMAEAA